jgi:hypothetical protein
LFVAGLAWLVLRGIVGASVPAMNAASVAREGGLLLVIPLCSILASMTIPLFFGSFLRYHAFDDGQRLLRAATIIAFIAATLSLGLVVVSFVALLRGANLVPQSTTAWVGWSIGSVPLFFVVSVLLFLVAFARQCPCTRPLRRASRLAAAGALVPVSMMVAAIAYSQFPEAMAWFPDLGGSLVAKGVGLAAAATLLWFAETFAVHYEDGAGRQG